MQKLGEAQILPAERQISVKGLCLALRCWGDPRQPAILAVHGWLDNAASFDRLAPYLADQFYLIAIDLPGHGLSDARHSADSYHYLDMAIDLLGVLEALQLNQIIGLGHSMGGSLLTLLAGAFPERFQACISIDALGPLIAQNLDMLTAFRKAATAKYLKPRNPPKIFADLHQAVQARLQGGLPLTPEAALILCQRNLQPVEGGFSWRTDARLRAPTLFKLSEADVLEIFQQITCPFLLIGAEQGLLAQHFNIESRLQSIAQATVEALPGGHHLHLEASASLVADCIKDFLFNKPG